MSEIIDYEEYNLDDDDVYIEGDPNLQYNVPSQGGIDLDEFETSTTAVDDADMFVTKENSSGTWYRKAFSKLWDYIKNKIGIASSGSTYLKKDGTWGTPDNNKVTQTISSSTNADYRVLLSGTADDTTRDEGARKDTDFKYNPSTNNLTVKKVSNVINNKIITGTGTAAQDKVSGVTNRYVPAKWTFNTGYALTHGDQITITLPVAGHSYGVYLSIDNGTTYKPVVTNGASRLTTHYGNNTAITLIYDANGSADSMFPLNGGDARSTVTGGVWRVINYYDSGNSAVTQTASTGNADYEVLFSVTADNTTRTEGARKNSNLKFNPSTGNLQATQLNGVNIGSSPKFSDTTYSAGTGLNLSSNKFNVALPRVAKSCNSIPGTNKVIFEEYNSGANYNLPSDAWYHITTMEGSDSAYATQLALGMTTTDVCYRRYDASAWKSWTKFYTSDNKPSKSDVGLGNVDNTADSNKSVKKATQDGSGNNIVNTYARKDKVAAQAKSITYQSGFSDIDSNWKTELKYFEAMGMYALCLKFKISAAKTAGTVYNVCKVPTNIPQNSNDIYPVFSAPWNDIRKVYGAVYVDGGYAKVRFYDSPGAGYTFVTPWILFF